MNAPLRPIFALAGLATLAVSLATLRESRTLAVSRDHKPFSLIETLLGESRRLFANHFFVKADAYFHSGAYPTIFDQKGSGPQTLHISADAGAAAADHPDRAVGFLNAPLDPLESFGRKFFPTEHTHLDSGGASTCTDPSHNHSHDHDHDHDGHPDHAAHDHDHDHDHGAADSGGDVREMLPWLKAATALDPNNVETYTVTAFWLRTKLNRSREAEEFIRDGLWNNPRHPVLLFELGRIFFQDRKDFDRARNVFEAALRHLPEPPPNATTQDRFLELQIVSQLAEMEEKTGRFARSIELWEHAKQISPNPAGPQKHIDDLRAKLAPPASSQP